MKTIHILFSRNKKIGSKLISYAAKYEKLNLENYPSHVAILINEKWIFESTFNTGVRIVPYNKWQEINEELYRVKYSGLLDNQTVLQTAANMWGKKYDWCGILYFLFCYLNLIIFKRELPDINKWQNCNKYFCTEYISILYNKDFSMKSPAKIYTMLRDNNE